MSLQGILTSSDLGASMRLLNKGKVRDIYEVDDSTLLLITTDRISAFDVTLGSAIPNKGLILTLLTAHWSQVFHEALPDLRTHFITLELPHQVPESLRSVYQNRSMQIRKFQIFKIEAIVRGYLTREAWGSYQADRTVCGIKMPEGLREGEAFPGGPIYTLSTRAEPPEHNQEIHKEQANQIVGVKYANRIKELSLLIYQCAAAYALQRGIIIADTKFEFGLDTKTDEVVLVDEILTPESSRFWPAEKYQVGRNTDGLDKQFLRDWLVVNSLEGKENVALPDVVILKTKEKYEGAFERLVGKTVAEVAGGHGDSDVGQT